MSYYKFLGFQKEPFSTSPDPLFFYRSLSHEAALKRLEVAVRLRRGLSLILGDVGFGKTTILRTLTQSFKDEPDFLFHVIFDPGFKDDNEFLFRLARSFGVKADSAGSMAMREAIEEYLFRRAAKEGKTVILVVDEGQKLSLENIEFLRTLLNYETNEAKLLQVVILAQTELLPRLASVKNFTNRISLQYTISPLSEEETREMIMFRMEKAGYCADKPLYSDEAISLIYRLSKGCPRRITMLCHDAIQRLVMEDKQAIDAELIRRLNNEYFVYL